MVARIGLLLYLVCLGCAALIVVFTCLLYAQGGADAHIYFYFGLPAAVAVWLIGRGLRWLFGA